MKGADDTGPGGSMAMIRLEQKDVKQKLAAIRSNRERNPMQRMNMEANRG